MEGGIKHYKLRKEKGDKRRGGSNGKRKKKGKGKE